MNNKKEIIDKIITDNIRIKSDGRFDMKIMHPELRSVISSKIKKYSFLYSYEIARDELIECIYMALLDLSNDEKYNDIFDENILNNKRFISALQIAVEYRMQRYITSKYGKNSKVEFKYIDEEREIDALNIKDESYDVCDNHSEYSIWLENHKDKILTENNLIYLHNRNGGTSTKHNDKYEITIKSRILKVLNNKDPKQENIKYQIKRIERILESNNFITDLKASLNTIDITDVSVDTRRAFNKNNTLTNQQLKELRVYLFKQLNKLNQQLDDKFNTSDIEEEYKKKINARKDAEPFICINDNEEYTSRKDFAEKYGLLNSTIRSAISKSKMSGHPHSVNKEYYVITKSKYDPDKDYSEYIQDKKGKKCKVVCTTTGEVFNTLIEAERKSKISYTHICSCCKGKRKSAGKHPVTGEKLVWMYLEDYNKTK